MMWSSYCTVVMHPREIKWELWGDTALLWSLQHYSQEPRFRNSPCPLTRNGLKKKRCMHSIEFYAFLKTKQILPFSATGINLEDIILSEISRSHRIKYYMIPLRWVSKFATHIETEGKPGWLWRIERRRKWSYINRQFSSCELWLEFTGGCLWFLGNQVVPALILTLNRTH